jgi:hypothetical protein
MIATSLAAAHAKTFVVTGNWILVRHVMAHLCRPTLAVFGKGMLCVISVIWIIADAVSPPIIVVMADYSLASSATTVTFLY